VDLVYDTNLQQTDQNKPFLTLLFVNPKDIATKGEGEDLSGTPFYHHAKFHTDQWHCRGDICPWIEKNIKNYSRFNIL